MGPTSVKVPQAIMTDNRTMAAIITGFRLRNWRNAGVMVATCGRVLHESVHRSWFTFGGTC